MLKHFANSFADYRIVVYENDSSDSTVQFLEDVSKQDDKFFFRSETLGTRDERELQRGRLRRMAMARNTLHDWVQTFLEEAHWDLVAMFDFDLGLFGTEAI